MGLDLRRLPPFFRHPPSLTPAIHAIPPIVTPNLITHSMEAPPSAANKEIQTHTYIHTEKHIADDGDQLITAFKQRKPWAKP
ncbi:hypothetical protein CesoFtcFv8_023424 [Champsocephalus esox]|uniref:Uncharacterized protein n=1 Tax=Champsocephalus esox TaxID=159716 RepID=A0AAN8B930_9TELE|nr:hypothetical protein CesoFtcFv8_023424 [Champsocephalus esox]